MTELQQWRSLNPATEPAERLVQFAVAVRESIPDMTAPDLEAVEVILRAVATQLRHLGASAAEAERTRLLALRRLGELLGPAQHGGDRRSEDFKSPAGDLNGGELSPTERNRRLLARKLADPANKPLVDDELSRDNPPSPSRLVRLIQRERATVNIPVPLRHYAVLVADPPWRYEGAEAANRQIENQYPTMSLDAIKSLDVPAADDCVLFLWATSPKLPEALSVMAAWGFTYRTSAVWVKDRIGMGYYFRQQHELVLVGKRGELPVPRPEDRPSSLLHGPRAEHSAKPASLQEAIEHMYPWACSNPSELCELFQRQPRAGWDGWGNEAGDEV